MLFIDPLFNSFHLVIGGVLYLLSQIALFDRFESNDLVKDRNRISFFILLISIGISAFFEILQPFFGRSCSIEDCMLSGLGGAIVYFIFNYQGRNKFIYLSLNCLVIFIIAIYPIYLGALYAMERSKIFPVLMQPQTRILDIVKPTWGSSIKHDTESCAIELYGEKLYSGVEIPLAYQDWSSYKKLTLNLVNLGKSDAILGLRVDDKKSKSDYVERYNSKAFISKNKRNVDFDISSLSKIENFDPAWIKRLLIFNNSSESTLHICIKEVKLVP